MTERRVETRQMVVTQANELATAAYSMTLMEKRLVMLVASMIRQEDDAFKRYRFPATDVLTFLGLRSNRNGYSELRKLTKLLLSRVVDMDLEGDGDYLQFQWMASARYVSAGKSSKGYAELELQAHSRMKPYLLELNERFSSLPFAEIAQLPSFHSVRIFEILWARSQKLKHKRIYIELDELKRMLEVTKNYPNFNDFKRFVLERAKKDLAEKTPLSFSYDTEKQGRRVVGLWFTVAGNDKAMQLGLDFPHTLSVTELPPVAETVRAQEQRAVVLTRLHKLGLRDEQAQNLVENYEPDYIAANLDVVEKRQKQGLVKNLLGYVFKALAQDFRKQESPEEKAARERKAAQDAQKREREDAEARYERERLQVIANITEYTPEGDLFEEFQPRLAELAAGNRPLAQIIAAHGGTLEAVKANKLLLGYFHQFMLDNYGVPKIRSFEAWQEHQS